ncbi:hypothetical protein DPEC_G00337450 [Dallia pectoralis]|uniref:Uncharacterized protein n=1 Tax=Dallia pectoralis TaxID=75939 RepID=A0ACC2F7T4_DALPE|nr:hypothetical protein DPEC_G00337450 [Dallia pectoralis]
MIRSEGHKVIRPPTPVQLHQVMAAALSDAGLENMFPIAPRQATLVSLDCCRALQGSRPTTSPSPVPQWAGQARKVRRGESHPPRSPMAGVDSQAWQGTVSWRNHTRA